MLMRLILSCFPLAVMADGPSGLVVELLKEEQHDVAALEFRRMALDEADADAAAGWYWMAAHQYSQARNRLLSDRMLDRAEDRSPFGLDAPVSWLRAENAAMDNDWSSASFHYESLLSKSKDAEVQAYAARGAAAAFLRQGELSNAERVLQSAGEFSDGEERALNRFRTTETKRPMVGGLLGVIPGLGYAYSGEYANALRSVILNGLFIWGMVDTAEEEQWGFFSVITFAELTWYTGSIYGGIDSAHRYNQRREDSVVSAIRNEMTIEPEMEKLPIVTLRLAF